MNERDRDRSGVDARRRAMLAMAGSLTVAASPAGRGAAAVPVTGEDRTVSYRTRTELAAVVPPSVSGAIAILGEAGREGPFAWRGDDRSQDVALDLRQGLFVPPAAVPSGRAGAWERVVGGPLLARWFGIIGDGAADDAPAINAALAAALRRRCDVRLPAGVIGVGSTIVLAERQVVRGCGGGSGDRSVVGNSGTVMVALARGIAVLDVASDCLVEDIAIDGAFLADAGVHLLPGARAVLRNLRVWRCRHSGYLWDATQNAAAYNVFGQLNQHLHTFLNGARNNDLFACSGTTWQPDWEANRAAHALPDFAATAIFHLLIEPSGRLLPGIATTTTVTDRGNDRNRIWGGIFEASATAIKVRNPAGITSGSASEGRFAIYDAELTTAVTLDTRTAAYAGTVHLADCTFIAAAENRGCLGSLGTVVFEGAGTDFLGFDRDPLRGWEGVRNNLLTLASFRSNDLVTSAVPGVTIRGATVAFDPASRRFAITAPAGPESGIYIAIGGPLVGVSATAIDRSTSALRPVMKVGFLIERAAPARMAVFALDDTPPAGRRLVGQFGDGYHEVFVPATTGALAGVAFAAGETGGFLLSNVTMAFVA